MEQRGEIVNRKRAQQIRDFSGLLYKDKITPTDLDGFIDFGDKVFVFFELKLAGISLTYGQRLALERLNKSALKAGKQVLTVIAEHNTSSDEDIDVANCIVVETIQHQGWEKANRGYTVRKVVNMFLQKYLPYYLIEEPKKEFNLDEIEKGIDEMNASAL